MNRDISTVHAILLPSHVIPVSSTGIQFFSPWTLFYTSKIHCPLNNLQILLYLNSSVKRWNDAICYVNFFQNYGDYIVIGRNQK
ncbi:hypothetical protein [Wolbachia endosymbiont of Ctenocephalides felis wCfeJ]|uniref:hypothetical protein n=1 Tax=Wolbachia endosymbiont of Ctenocephalides felis wCfeJ TaxID=2732594 RepID=UPI001FEA657F|nr:hypothetical protein [Wolbachia endosymbiont of Ctenocephalides felis wCfeJ]